ncbi:hypothetical protein GZL_09400 [Streptomyces sp. 769]|nr:hypothetical protein GZL_00013 [Streptomyces sp. 769]AJC61918.1 hypothetical protein GZL_09400 [Streptomyces sp. 769]
MFDLLALVGRSGADLACVLPAVLDHLHDLAEPRARADGSPPAPARHRACARGRRRRSGCWWGPDPAGGLLGSDLVVRALGCLLEYAVARACAGDAMADDVVVDLLAGALAARVGDEAVVTAIDASPAGPARPRRRAHRRAPRVVRPRPGRPSRGCAGPGTTRWPRPAP